MRSGLLTYRDVPKDLADNLRWRRFLWDAGRKDKRKRALIRRSCAEDFLFYANSFLWTYDPRKSDRPCQPFLTYGFQDEGAMEFIDCIDGGEDVLFEKSRDMGMSVMVMSIADWDMRFRKDRSIKFLSRKEELVDATDNPDCLFAKLDYIHERLPSFLRFRRIRQKLHVYFPHTRSVGDGESTNSDASRGGRRSWILLDEFAFMENGDQILNATGDVTNVRMFGSTPNGIGNAHYAMRQSGIRRVTWHWTRHPEKAAGLYSVSKRGRVKVLDEEWHRDHPGYEFQSTTGEEQLTDIDDCKRLRSPWFDKECRRRNSKVSIAQEVGISYLGSGSPFFDGELLTRLNAETVRPPLHRGTASDFMGWEEWRDVGRIPLHLWFNPDAKGRPPQETTYSIGVDISTGTGASDSTISVADATTGEKVAEYVSNQILPEDLAFLVVEGFCKWFTTPKGKPFLVPDGNGPGGAFCKRVIDRLGYTHVYYHTSEDERKRKKAARPGYPANRQLKEALFTSYRSALAEGKFVNRSSRSLEQHQAYVYDGNGGVAHIAEKNTEDASGNKANHGDIVYADCLAWRGIEHAPKPQAAKKVIPQNCFYRRQQSRHAAMKASGREWFD